MKVLSLFDGISVARVALGERCTEYYAAEIDTHAIKVSSQNYPDIKRLGDVRTVEFIPDIDLLIGGSPCQDLSIAKKDRKGLDGDRSGLFWEYMRILKLCNPKYFILENVNSMPKKDRDIITKEMGVEPIMIDAALVSAQSRKRLFWTNIPVKGLPENRNIRVKDILEPDGEEDEKHSVETQSTMVRLIQVGYVGNTNHQGNRVYSDEGKSPTLTKGSGVGGSVPVKIVSGLIKIGHVGNTNSQANRVYDPDGKSCTLSANGGGLGAKTGLYEITGDTAKVKEATKQGYAIAKDGDAIDLSFPKSKTRRGRVGEKAKNLMTSSTISVFTNKQIRKLTPKECERLQSLPDDYTAGISNTQRYRCLGNAFNAEVVRFILSFV